MKTKESGLAWPVHLSWWPLGAHGSFSAGLSRRGTEQAGPRMEAASSPLALPACLAEAEHLGVAATHRIPSPWGRLSPYSSLPGVHGRSSFCHHLHGELRAQARSPVARASNPKPGLGKASPGSLQQCLGKGWGSRA